MSTISGPATAVTDAGEAPVSVSLRQVPDGIRNPYWSGTMTLRSVEVWREIDRTRQLRLRLPDGQEGPFDVQDGVGMPPTDARPATFRITRNDGESFTTG
ncbi:hypothetical protein ACQEV2_11820 [Streptomyces sp. CA-251387]|uniref:hypothetical protein n=1 Tax=Streptomyces sp. CA-251387 TaxID=3240064 RepID=UPI003D8F54D0